MIPADGTIIELGVAAGAFACAMLEENPTAFYLGIDRWADHHDLREMQAAIESIERFNHAKHRASVSRLSFRDAMPLVPDGYADLVYVDGYAHTGQDNGRTLEEWYPKVKHGGIFAGHDYCPKYPQTIAAVDLFALRNALTINVIQESPHASWWLTKPMS